MHAGLKRGLLGGDSYTTTEGHLIYHWSLGLNLAILAITISSYIQTVMVSYYVHDHIIGDHVHGLNFFFRPVPHGVGELRGIRTT